MLSAALPELTKWVGPAQLPCVGCQTRGRACEISYLLAPLSKCYADRTAKHVLCTPDIGKGVGAVRSREYGSTLSSRLLVSTPSSTTAATRGDRAVGDAEAAAAAGAAGAAAAAGACGGSKSEASRSRSFASAWCTQASMSATYRLRSGAAC